jgi:hypothetical protein
MPSRREHIFRAANYDAWATNDFFPSDGRMGEWSLASYECLSVCKSKGRNSAASGTNVSFHLPISVNATVSISSVFRYYIPFACIDPSFGPYHIIVISYFLSRKLMFHSGAANLPTDSGASVVPVSRR